MLLFCGHLDNDTHIFIIEYKEEEKKNYFDFDEGLFCLSSLAWHGFMSQLFHQCSFSVVCWNNTVLTFSVTIELFVVQHET